MNETSAHPTSPAGPSGQTPGTPTQEPGTMDRVYQALTATGVVRQPQGKWIGGVCTGLAVRLGVDPLIVRAFFVLSSIVFGAGISLYLVAWLLLPGQDGRTMLERALRFSEGRAIALLVIAAISVLPDGNDDGWGFGIGGGGFAVVAAAVGIALYLTRTDQGKGELEAWRRRRSALASGAPMPWPAAGALPYGVPPQPAVSPASSHSASHTASHSASLSASADFVGHQLPQWQARSTGNAAADAGARLGEQSSGGWAQPEPPMSAPSSGWVPATGNGPSPALVPARRGVSLAAATGVTLLALLVAGVVVVMMGAGPVTAGTAAVLAAAFTGVVGTALVVAGLRGRGAGWLAPVAVGSVLATGTLWAMPSGLAFPPTAGELSITADSPAKVNSEQVTAGDLTLNYTGLTAAELGTGEDGTARVVNLTVGVGRLEVVLPPDLPAQVNLSTRAGQTTRLAQDGDAMTVEAGLGVAQTIRTGTGEPRLVVNAEVGLGEARVVTR